MKIIYLILAHNNPKQLERLIARIITADVHIFIHLDKNTSMCEFDYLESEYVTFIENRVNSTWGDFNVIQATLNLLNVVNQKFESGFVVLLSGSDYPVKPTQYIKDFLYTSNTDIYMDIHDAYDNWVNFARRIDYYKINYSTKRGDFVLCKGYSHELWKLLVRKKITFKDMLEIMFLNRRNTLDLKFHGGSQWWAMNFRALTVILEYVNENWIALENYFKYTFIPDEFFFQTIVKKSCNNTFKIGDSLTYVNWKKAGRKLPVTFELEDFEELNGVAESKLFARKFDIEIDSKILDLIDKNLLLTTENDNL
jgi:hypothetical protein